jgi:hypothetical protein
MIRCQSQRESLVRAQAIDGAKAGREDLGGGPEHDVAAVERRDAGRCSDQLLDRHQAHILDPDAGVTGDAGIGRLDRTQMGRRLLAVDAVDEDHPGIADRPGRVRDRIEDTARIELADDMASPWVDEVVRRPLLHRGHERVGDGDGEVEVAHPRRVELQRDELENVGVIDAEHPHVRAAAGAALLDRLGRDVEDLHQRDRSARGAARRGDEIAGGTQPREREAGPAAGLLDLGGPADGLEHTGRRIVDGNDEACRELAEWSAGVHEGRRVRNELEFGHHPLEGGARRGDLVRRVAELPFDRAHVMGDATEQLLWRLDHSAALAREVAGAEDRESVIGQRRRHVSTVRSRAWARNRPRKRLAWILVGVLSGLLALAGRALASPSVEDDQAAEAAEPEIDEELARSSLDVGSELYDDSIAVMSGLVDATTYHDADARHQRPSPFGRLDLVFAWRRTDRVTEHAPGTFVAMPGEPTRRDEVWLVAIWRN